ncbi:DNA-dependent protein kinase catalytic subunit (Fragment), partial [Durusdinium trenchii]
AIALLAKWHPTGRSILQECCALVEAPPIQARLQDRSDGLRLALCTEQLLLMCPWALSDAPEELEASESTESGPRRKLFARVLQRLATGNLKVLRALLSGLLELCRDCVQPDESVLGTLDVTGRRRPPRPTGDAVRAVRRER